MNVSSSSLRRGRQSSIAALISTRNSAAAAVGGGGIGSGIGNVVRQSSRRRIVSGRVLDDGENQTKRRKTKATKLVPAARARDLADGGGGGEGGIFYGVVACLSGQTCDVKDRIHDIICGGGVESADHIDNDGTKRGGGRGGTTMGNFDPRFVTHLVLDAPMGSKYDHWRRNYRLHLRHEAAASSTSSRPSPYEWADRLHVVRTSWVEACLREGRRVPEEDYRLPSPSEDEGDDRGNAMHSETKSTSAGRRGSGILADKKGASEGRDGAVNVTSSSMARRIAVNEGTMSSPSSKSRPSSGGRRTSERQFSLPEEIVRHAPTLVERCDCVIQQQQQQQRLRHSRFANAASTAHCDGNVRLFAGQSFLLVGFDDGWDDESNRDDDNCDGCGKENDKNNKNDDNDNIIGLRGRRRALKCKVAQLIRKSGGTIYYEPNEWITRVVLSLDDDCYRKEDENDNAYLRRKLMWDDVRYFCREHPNGPICVNVEWVLASVYFFYSSLNHRAMSGGSVALPTPFPPEPRPPLQISKSGNRGGGRGSTYNTVHAVTSTAVITEQRRSKSNNSRVTGQQRQKPTTAGSPLSSIFHGDVFVIMPSPKKSNDSAQLLCYEYEEMEAIIINNGGSLLSRSLLREAIRMDDVKDSAQKKMNLIKFSVKPSSDNPDRNPHGQSRKYYVVSNITPDYRLNNQLIELSNLGIDLIPVSSVWIAACTRNDCKYDPEEYPLLFQPQTWPIRLINSFADPTKSLSENGGRNSIKPKRSLLISVTGFVDSSRYGIISMLHEIGAGYTDNLSRKNTHLICKDGSGQKYVKALEWGLRVVSIDWLYHIVRHGCEDESEDRFSFVFGARKEPVDEITQTQLSLKRNTINTTFSTNKDERKGTSSSLNDKDDYDKEEVEEMANQSAEKRGKTQRLQPFEINGHITVKGGGWADDATKEKYSSRIRRYLAQVSSPPPPNDLDYCPGQYPSRDEGAYLCGASSNKRLLIANHRTLDEPVSELITNIIESRARHLSGNGNISVPNAHREQITPSSLLLPPPFQEQTGIQDGDEILAMSHLETETQFTTGTILANADIGDMFLNNKIGHGDFSSEEVPPSQANDAESNGESQVIWFAAARG